MYKLRVEWEVVKSWNERKERKRKERFGQTEVGDDGSQNFTFTSDVYIVLG